MSTVEASLKTATSSAASYESKSKLKMSKPEVAKQKTKKASSTSHSSHPTYLQMVIQAIRELKEVRGSSRHAIFKFMMAKFNISPGNPSHVHFNVAIRNGLKKGELKIGKSSASFKIGDKQVQAEKDKAKKEKAKQRAEVIKKKNAEIALAKKTTKKSKSSPKKVTKKIEGIKKETSKKLVAPDKKITATKKSSKKVASTKKVVAKNPSKKIETPAIESAKSAISLIKKVKATKAAPDSAQTIPVKPSTKKEKSPAKKTKKASSKK
jgi:histone H1/5